MTAIRLMVAFAVIGVIAGEALAARPTGPIPLPRPRPALKTDKLASFSGHAAVGRNAATPLALAPQTLRGGITASIPQTGSFRQATFEPVNASAQRPPGPSRPSARSAHASVPLAMATSSNTSPLDLSAVKQAIDLVRKSRLDEATSAEGTVADPLARKVIEWVILRSDDRCGFLPLRRVPCRQSELAEPRHAAAPRRGGAVAAAPRSAGGHRLLRQRAAAQRQGPICARARPARTGRPGRRAGGNARSVALRQFFRRP